MRWTCHSPFRENDYKKKLKKRQARLGELGRKAFEKGISTVLVFEGPDASGKGGAIRRTVWSLDARTYRVHQFAAPTDEEQAHHYLWRFWRKLPRAGHVSGVRSQLVRTRAGRARRGFRDRGRVAARLQ